MQGGRKASERVQDATKVHGSNIIAKKKFEVNEMMALAYQNLACFESNMILNHMILNHGELLRLYFVVYNLTR